METSLVNDVIEVRLPLKPEYKQVIRAIVGVIAGLVSFNYDEIMHVRVAVSEVFDLFAKYDRAPEGDSKINELTVRFAVLPDKVDILVYCPSVLTCDLDSNENQESLTVIKSLMDELDFCDENAAVRMSKHKSTQNV